MTSIKAAIENNLTNHYGASFLRCSGKHAGNDLYEVYAIQFNGANHLSVMSFMNSIGEAGVRWNEGTQDFTVLRRGKTRSHKNTWEDIEIGDWVLKSIDGYGTNPTSGLFKNELSWKACNYYVFSDKEMQRHYKINIKQVPYD